MNYTILHVCSNLQFTMFNYFVGVERVGLKF
jgi:hypothetical protein